MLTSFKVIFGLPNDAQHFLSEPVSLGNHHDTAHSQLIKQCLWSLRGGGGQQDPVERGIGG